jgi:hypothetical protein
MENSLRVRFCVKSIVVCFASMLEIITNQSDASFRIPPPFQAGEESAVQSSIKLHLSSEDSGCLLFILAGTPPVVVREACLRWPV